MPTQSQELQLNDSLFSFVKTPEFLYGENPDYEGDQCGIVISLDTVRKYDFTHEGHNRSIYKHALTFCGAVFGSAFNPNHPVCSNFAYATYTGDSLRLFARPVIALHEGEIQLLMGSQSKDDHREYVKVPLVNKDGNMTLEGSTINRLSLTSIDLKRNNETIKLPIVIFRADNVIYAISIRTHVEGDFFELQDAWEDRNIDTLKKLIAPLYGASANLSNMFGQAFTAKQFPESGLVIKITSGKKTTIKTTKNNKEIEFRKIVFGIDTSGLPYIPVSAYSDGQEQTVGLDQVTSITCYDNYEAAVPILQGHIPTATNPWYLWIMGQGNDPNQKPRHQMYTGFVPPRLSKIVEAQKQPGYFLGASKPINAVAAKTKKPTESDTPNYDDKPL